MSLTTEERKHLPASLFGLPRRRAYPIDTVKRARSALARAAQFATPSEEATIRRRVHHLYPEIQLSGLGRERSR
ncbi:MAG: hypothetical protein ACRD2H_06340 [Terriglobales bacterium]